ncbi:MAG: replication protein DnaC [Thermoanaerobacterium sp.]|jgi:DNA replication protein DnaC|nr:replication protein DnaC [Thermoanaerobacterium sp.]
MDRTTLEKIVESIKSKPNLRLSNYEAAIEHMKQENYSCFDTCNKMFFPKDDILIKCPIATKRETIRNKEGHLPLRTKEMSFETFDVNRNPDAFYQCKFFVEDYKQNQDINLILYGDLGTGKTHLAISIMKELLYFSNFDNIEFEVFTNSYEFLKDTERLERLKNCDLLILDDLGAFPLNNWALETLYDIIDWRYKNKLSHVITTNIGVEAESSEEFINIFSNQLDPRITSRLLHNSNIVKLEGLDSRLIGADE